MDAVRTFQMDIKNRFLMILVYIVLTSFILGGFLFDLYKSNIYRDIQKIESLISQCVPIPQENKNPRGS
jgi:hypothetical protein